MDMNWTQALTIVISIFALFLVAVPFIISRMDSFQKESNAKFEQVLMRIDAKFDAVNTRFNGLENRLTSMESEIRNTNQRIDSTNQRVTDMGQKLDQRISDMKTDINQRLSSIEGYLVPKKVFDFKENHHKEDHEEPKEN